MDKMLKEAEEKKASKRKKLIELQNDFKQLLLKNKKLPEHVRLDRAVGFVFFRLQLHIRLLKKQQNLNYTSVSGIVF